MKKSILLGLGRKNIELRAVEVLAIILRVSTQSVRLVVSIAAKSIFR